jgi:2,4-dienoyl-CoA reductase-like NADH-dependent reductase (Old Yellow Enzyme family)
LVPKEMTTEDIAKFKRDWVAGVKRALVVGFDVSLKLLFLANQY